MRYKRAILILAVIVLMSSVFLGVQLSCAAEERKPYSPEVADKKLIRMAREMRKQVINVMGEIEGKEAKVQFLQEKVDSWQKMGLDGLVFPIQSGQWWRVDPPLTADDVQMDIEVFKSINWGRLTDNFLLTSSSVWWKTKAADWFSDEDWDVVLANTRLAAKLAKEIGFKGVLFDWEQYGCPTHGAWRIPFFYKLYATESYKSADETSPHSFEETVAKVRQRGQQYGEALSSEYADMTLFVIPGLYENAWREMVLTESKLEDTHHGLWPAFVDGLLMGLDERATIVDGTEKTYCDTRYSDMMTIRDQALNKGLVVSSVPELAKKRITFSVAVWTDVGWGPDRFSATDVRVNQRNPERHMHAVHNALAASDKYAWIYGEIPWLMAEPTPLMQEYWQATIDARKKHDLNWQPGFQRPDPADYTALNQEMARKDAAFWDRIRKSGWKVAMELPTQWRFKFDIDDRIRYNKSWFRSDIDDSSWPLISSLKCWQSQGTPATGNAVYRIRFDAPADLDPATQDIRLAFGGYSIGKSPTPGLKSWSAVYVNGTQLGLQPLIPVSKLIKPGQSNWIGIVIFNKAGAAGLMGHVALLVRELGHTSGPDLSNAKTIFSEDFSDDAEGTPLSKAGWTMLRPGIDMQITTATKFGLSIKALDKKKAKGPEVMAYRSFESPVKKGDTVVFTAKVYHGYGGSIAGLGMRTTGRKGAFLVCNGNSWTYAAEDIGTTSADTFWPWDNNDPWAKILTATIYVDAKTKRTWATLTDSDDNVYSSTQLSYDPGKETLLSSAFVYMKNNVPGRNMDMADLKVERIPAP